MFILKAIQYYLKIEISNKLRGKFVCVLEDFVQEASSTLKFSPLLIH